jgi:hypothetical protein
VVELNRSKPLQRTKPLRTVAPLTTTTLLLPCGHSYGTADEARNSKRAQGKGAVVEKCRDRRCGQWHVRAPQSRTDTGPSRDVRALVMERDNQCCQACGAGITGRPYSIQHRDARGMGGTSNPAANSPSNLVLVCGSATTPGSCHLACEQRDPEMHSRGFWLKRGEDPERVPVMIAGPGYLIAAWLLPDGTRTFDAPERAA